MIESIHSNRSIGRTGLEVKAAYEARCRGYRCLMVGLMVSFMFDIFQVNGLLTGSSALAL